jgi:biotin operon repressor
VGVNRTDRLYALVEELRAVAPRPRSARWLATRFEVSARTIERDISALQQSGVSVWAESGRAGGYCLDKERTLPPVNFTPGEAMALAVALRHVAGTPFGQDGAAALRKVLAAMRKDDAEAARDLAGRVYLVGAADPPPVPAVITDALSARPSTGTCWPGAACARRSARFAPTGSPRSPSPRRSPRRARCAARTWTFRPASCGASSWTDRRGRAVADAAPRRVSSARAAW